METSSPEFHVVATLPRPWESSGSFHDALYEWMNRAPWVAISAAAHLLLYLILAAIPWDQLRENEQKMIVASVAAPPPVPFDTPVEVVKKPEVTEPPIDPVPLNAELSEVVPEETSSPATIDWSTPDAFSAESMVPLVGLGGGFDGKLNGRRRPGRSGTGGGSGTERALEDALRWLVEHQSPDGSWSADGFVDNCGEIGSGRCTGLGQGVHDVGLTGLSLLAMMGDGSTPSRGRHADVVRRGIHWLHRQQDHETGLIGEPTTKEFIYSHAIATLAICEAYYFDRSPLLMGTAQRAIDYIQRARNPYGAWRYDVPPTGDSDTSITGWMIFALASAREAGLRVDDAALEGGLAWIDEMTDITGRVGYDTRGSGSARTTANAHFPQDRAETMTAVALLCRIFMAQPPAETDHVGQQILHRQAELLADKPPTWDTEDRGCDMYYWYYGTYAMYQIGGDPWRRWNLAMKEAVLDNQCREGDAKGSWNPVGPWGYSGGRVYSTAMMTLCMEVYFRYARVL